MTLFSKLRWLAGVLIIFLVILATNLIDKDNFARVEENVETIYEHRLLTKDLIFDLQKVYHEKEIAILMHNEEYFETKANRYNERALELILDCEKIIDSEREEKVLRELEENHIELETIENKDSLFSETVKNDYLDQLDVLIYNVDELSEVQIEEGRKEKLRSRNALDNMELFSRIEIYLLIFLAIIFQIIILVSPKKKEEA